MTTSMIFSLRNTIGCLVNALKVFEENHINVVHIESRRSERAADMFDIYVDLETDHIRLQELIRRLKKQVASITLNDFPVPQSPAFGMSPKETLTLSPWFPKTVYDLDRSANRVLMYGTELDADHPGFTDKVYRQRRAFFTEVALNYRCGQPIPRIEYTNEEKRTWGVVFRELTKLYPTYACREYMRNWPLLQQCGYREDNIPQLQDVSEFLKARTGFTLRPVAGYLSSRDFLAGLAFRVFHCTQYIRHGSEPLYTPEPDCCHELFGHIPLLADPSFAQFSQELGLCSLGASDDEVAKLSTCYFFSVEFGLCKQDGDLKVFGAGLLSSASELKHALTGKALKKPFEPLTTCQQECLITTFQDVYFFTESFEEAKEQMRNFASTIKRPFAVRYNPYTQSVDVLDNTRNIGYLVSEVKGELCIVSDALRRVQQLEKARTKGKPLSKAMEDSIDEQEDMPDM
ncbi:tryptophan 5-hydroxylase 1-like isoform X2 [Mya arenaria]|nr:tryptophan 5-hydroxylase 1-like isoform X2 [Mya arenaria]